MVDLARYYTADDIAGWMENARQLLRMLRGEASREGVEAHLDALHVGVQRIELWVNSADFPDRPNAVERIGLLYWALSEIRRYVAQETDAPDGEQVMIYALYVGTSFGQISRYMQHVQGEQREKVDGA